MTPEESTVRLGPAGIGEPADREDVQERLQAMVSSLQELGRELAELRARLELDEAVAERLEGRLLDLRSVERRLSAHAAGVLTQTAAGEVLPPSALTSFLHFLVDASPGVETLDAIRLVACASGGGVRERGVPS